MGVWVERVPADVEGEDIIVSTLTNEASQTERGRNEIEITSVSKIKKTVSLLKDEFIPPGSMQKIHTPKGPKVGLVTEYSLSLSVSNSKVSFSPQVTLEIPNA
jgi:hypothetical protein